MVKIQKNAIKNDIIINYKMLFCGKISNRELCIIQNKVYNFARKYNLERDFKENGML